MAITGGTRKITAPVHFMVWTVIFAIDIIKITVHTVKFTEAHCNFSSAIMNYPNVTINCQSAVFSVFVWAQAVKHFWKFVEQSQLRETG